jgi:hypothetical protein
MKPLTVVSGGTGRAMRERGQDVGVILTNGQCKDIHKCHYEFSPVQLIYATKNEKKKE